MQDRLAGWRLQATGYYLLAVLCTIITPILAGMLQYQVTDTANAHWLVVSTIGIWPYVYLVTVVLVLIILELINAAIVSERSYDYDERIDNVVVRIAKRAELEPVPEVVYLPSKHLINAGAGTSYLYGNKVILFGDILKLKKEELEAVIAHEIAHLRMGDVRLGHVLGSLMVSLRVVNLMIFLACIGAMFVDNHDVMWFLAATYIVTLIGSRLARSFQLKVSRICEYRADALAVEWTSPGHRAHLINALKSVRELSIVVALRKNELNEIDSGTHPTLRNRARSLGLFSFMKRAVRFGS